MVCAAAVATQIPLVAGLRHSVPRLGLSRDFASLDSISKSDRTLKLIRINAHIARQDRARKVLNFGRRSSCAAHTFAGSAELVSSLMRSELSGGLALGVSRSHHQTLDVGFHCRTRLFGERAVSRRCDQHRDFSRSGGPTSSQETLCHPQTNPLAESFWLLPHPLLWELQYL